jgi:hypothetical protein
MDTRGKQRLSVGKNALGIKTNNMGYKMKGPSLYKKLKVNRNGYANMPDGRSTSSPFQQDKDDKKSIQGPKTEGNIKLQSSENQDIALTGGKGESTSEKIADYEDRIEFIKEGIFNTGKATPQQKKDLAKLKQELAITRRGNKKPPFKKKK